MIVAGFGFRQGANATSLQAALTLALAAATDDGVLPVTLLATLDDKAATLAPLAGRLGIALVPVSSAALALVQTPTSSIASRAARGAGSVAEACALVVAGAGARLLGQRQISPDRMATCALAQGPGQ